MCTVTILVCGAACGVSGKVLAEYHVAVVVLSAAMKVDTIGNPAVDHSNADSHAVQSPCRSGGSVDRFVVIIEGPRRARSYERTVRRHIGNVRIGRQVGQAGRR